MLIIRLFYSRTTQGPAAYSGSGETFGWYFFKYHSDVSYGSRDTLETFSGEIQDETSVDIDKCIKVFDNLWNSPSGVRLFVFWNYRRFAIHYNPLETCCTQKTAINSSRPPTSRHNDCFHPESDPRATSSVSIPYKQSSGPGSDICHQLCPRRTIIYEEKQTDCSIHPTRPCSMAV